MVCDVYLTTPNKWSAELLSSQNQCHALRTFRHTREHTHTHTHNTFLCTYDCSKRRIQPTYLPKPAPSEIKLTEQQEGSNLLSHTRRGVEFEPHPPMQRKCLHSKLGAGCSPGSNRRNSFKKNVELIAVHRLSISLT